MNSSLDLIIYTLEYITEHMLLKVYNWYLDRGVCEF